mmetsp:Transcript_16435/g.33438  ORF Transcript_16435/g.33438 Transcript_16435/m.33438 type:complete len:204 (+) Transcript_16435:49-660(+)
MYHIAPLFSRLPFSSVFHFPLGPSDSIIISSRISRTFIVEDKSPRQSFSFPHTARQLGFSGKETLRATRRDLGGALFCFPDFFLVPGADFPPVSPSAASAGCPCASASAEAEACPVTSLLETADDDDALELLSFLSSAVASACAARAALIDASSLQRINSWSHPAEKTESENGFGRISALPPSASASCLSVEGTMARAATALV